MFEGMFSGRKELDIRTLKQRGKELYEAIEAEVAHTQAIVIQQLPNILIMNREQYDDQRRLFNVLDFDEVPFYKTKHNIMEIEVK